MILISKIKNYFQKSCKTKTKNKTKIVHEIIISCYQENYKRLACKIIRCVFLYRENPVNKSLKMQN